MLKISKILALFTFSILLLSGCSQKSYHNEMIEQAKEGTNKRDIKKIKKSYSETLANVKNKNKEFINILSDKSLGDVLKELEILDGNFYFLKSSDFLLPKSRIKIHNMNELNKYLNAVMDKELFIKKRGSIYLVKLLSKSESKKQSIHKKQFNLKGEISVEELIKLITLESGYEVSLGSYIDDINKFKNSIISINTKTLLDAINSLAHAKNVYVDIDYDKEMINVKRYKDMVVELKIPLLNLKTTSETSTEGEGGESNVSNTSEVVLYKELDLMLKSIISNDKISTYHIDQASGLIFLKSTKSVENAVRTIVKAYEMSFGREAIVEFERIELALNKNRQYGIGSVSENRQTSTGAGVIRELSNERAFSFISDNTERLLEITATANNEIGRILNYNKNVLVLKNNITTVQTVNLNKDYVKEVNKTEDTETNTTTYETEVESVKEGTTITAMAKIFRDKIFLNITPTIKGTVEFEDYVTENGEIKLPQYNEQSYNISKEVALGETAIVGSIISHVDAKSYSGILPLEGFAIGGSDDKSYVRKEIVYVVTVRDIKGF